VGLNPGQNIALSTSEDGTRMVIICKLKIRVGYFSFFAQEPANCQRLGDAVTFEIERLKLSLA